MDFHIETERLILRDIRAEDEDGLFELDSNPEVHLYLGRTPVTNRDQVRAVILFIQQQYQDNGIGRWAVIEKATNRFIGWSGLKLMTEPVNEHVNYYDLGYRFIQSHWGKGYATETALASLRYGFETLNASAIYGMADVHNLASRHVLEKAGLRRFPPFDFDGIPHDWFQITREEWLATQ